MAGALSVAAPASAERVFTVDGAKAPGPARYDRVRVVEQGPRGADSVLVLVPGTSGGAAYFRPVARDIVAGLSAAPPENAFVKTVIPFLRRAR